MEAAGGGEEGEKGREEAGEGGNWEKENRERGEQDCGHKKREGGGRARRGLGLGNGEKRRERT